MNPTSPSSKVCRRHFLAATGAALALPTIIPASVLGRGGNPAPSQRLALGIVGCGNMGTSNTQAFLAQSDCQVVAACDVDQEHLQHLVGIINKKYQNKDCKALHDYRELM